ncbi:DNA polymerase III subunit beta [Mycoplasma iguanae]|uniref:DNA polymerase III subunit beta n=1 Tax=Mycoplasma iguanae TaxID=292461 RepID=A0ABY5R884_9MOLU|nr:DNA polymerase III subunit beta [Mycoplasma iguanae]UVD81693.1 DNA polymerase III subunit beta [Mycoplasma iguanae]
MKFKIKKEMIEKALENVGIAIDYGNLNISMRGILFEVNADNIVLIGSDGEFSIKKQIMTSENLIIEKVGKVLVITSLLKNIIKRAEGFISFEQNNTSLKINNNLDEFTINLLDEQDYPTIEFNDFGISFEIDMNAFRNLIKNTSFAASTNESVSRVLQYVNLINQHGTLRINATDSFRFATESYDINCEEEFDISLPVKSLKRLMSSNLNGIIKFIVEEKKISIQKNDEIYQIKAFDGIYKDLSNVFPKQETIKYVLEINKKELNDLLSKAAFSAGDKYNRIKMHFSKDSFLITSVYEELGTSKVYAKNFKWKGEELVVSLNYRYLKEAINVFEDEIAIFLNEKVDRILILSKSNPKNKQLIAPHKG